MYSLNKVKLHIVKEINKVLRKKVVQASHLVYPPNRDMGDLSLPCFEIAKKLNKKQNEIGGLLVKKLSSKISEVSSIKTAGPYLNFILNKEYLSREVIKKIGKQKDEYGKNKIGKKKRVMIEYSNANTHKEYHVGHLRNICYGDAVNRILDANGYGSISVSYINDFGIHVAKTLWYFSVHKRSQISAEENKGALLGRMYSEAVKTLEKDKTGNEIVNLLMKRIESRKGQDYQLWRKTRKWSIEYFSGIYKELGVKFEHIFYENEFIEPGRKEVNKLIKKGILEKSDGAIIANLEKYNLGVLVVVRSDGTALYPIADISMAQTKIKKFKLDRSVYVVDVRQSLYFKQLFKLLELAGIKKELIHLSYEFVKLPTGMMSSRSGNVILYEELKEQLLKRAEKETKKRHKDWDDKKIKEVTDKITVGAIKFEMIKVRADNVISFDINKALSFEGFTAAYLQYTYARIQSIFKKAKLRTKKLKQQLKAENLKEQKEYELALKLAKYPEMVERAGINYDPSELAKYLFELAQVFNDYYHNVPVLKAKAEVKDARLALLSSVSQVIKNGLGLLGIEVIEEM